MKTTIRKTELNLHVNPARLSAAIAAASASIVLMQAKHNAPPKSIEIEMQAEATIAFEGKGKDGDDKPPRFEMVAYAGGPIRPKLTPPLPHPVVVDLAGMEFKKQSIPALKDHDSKQHVGHTESLSTAGGKLTARGVISGGGSAATEVKMAARNGFTWPVSLGADLFKLELVKSGASATVNGRTVRGPVYIARASRPREVSFLTIAADDDAEATIAAAAATGVEMTFAEWLRAKGFQPDKLSKAQRVTLKASWKLEMEAAAKDQTEGAVDDDDEDDEDDEADLAAQKKLTKRKLAAAADPEVASLKAELRDLIDSSKREREIYQLCGEKHQDIAKEAIENDWDDAFIKRAIKAADLEASLPRTLQIRTGRAKDAPNENVVLEAAMAMTLGLPEIEDQFKPNVLEAAQSDYRHVGLQQVIMIAAVRNGYAGGIGERIHQANIQDVLGYAMMRGGPSTLSLPGILSNLANKELLAGYMEEDQTWREIAGIKSVNNFQQATSYRLLDNMEYEELAPGAKIQHGSVGEESYTRQARTYAKMFSLARPTIINDDIGAFDDLRNRLGRGSSKKLNNVFWTRFMDNSSFFTTGRVNYITGATTTLLVDGVGLQLGITAFRKLRSPAADGSKRLGNIVSGRAEILLVPPELEFAALRLYQSTMVNTGGGATAESVGNANIHAGKYKPVVCDWLSDSNFTGYSATAWYLFRSPTQLPAITVSFLNGVQTPTVESATADFDELGINFRGYHDFGVDQAEYLCGIKSKGAA